MRKYLMLAAMILALSVGCDKEEEKIATEQFRGTYRVSNPSVVGDKLDSVTLTIEENFRYRLVHYPERSGKMVDICNSSGEIDNFGTNIAIFRPKSVGATGCDSLRVPRDTFVTDFVNHGDTIWMDRDEDTLVYELRLRK